MFDFGFPISGTLPASSSIGPNVIGWLFTRTLGLLVIVFVFYKWKRKTSLDWVKVAAKAKKKVWKKLNVPLSHHIWGEDYAGGEQSSTCCVCLTPLTFSQNLNTKAVLNTPVHQCVVCGVAAHFYCSQYAAKHCKCFPQAGHSHVLHHWSERLVKMNDNPESYVFCSYCDEPCTTALQV